jgi:hypothetical protein
MPQDLQHTDLKSKHTSELKDSRESKTHSQMGGGFVKKSQRTDKTTKNSKPQQHQASSVTNYLNNGCGEHQGHASTQGSGQATYSAGHNSQTQTRGIFHPEPHNVDFAGMGAQFDNHLVYDTKINWDELIDE